LCFNAVSSSSPFPETSAKYEILDDLFDRICVSANLRIEQYSNIDPALKRTIHEHLTKFVDICSLSITLLHGGFLGDLKVIAKATFFDSDSRVGAEPATFESIVRKQRAVVDPLTLESVLKSENKLAELQKALKISDGKLDELRSVLEGTKNVCDDIKRTPMRALRPSRR
jgi:hypothetical protein